MRIHPTVALKLTVRIYFIDIFSDGFNFIELVKHKALSAKARFHRHDKHKINKVDIRQYGFRGRLRFQRNADFFPAAAYKLYRGKDIFRAVRLKMHVDKVGTGIAELFDIFYRLGYHEMHIEKHIGCFSQRLDNRNTD